MLIVGISVFYHPFRDGESTALSIARAFYTGCVDEGIVGAGEGWEVATDRSKRVALTERRPVLLSRPH